MVTTFSLLFRSFGMNGFTELIMQREELTQSLASNLFWIELGLGAVLTASVCQLGPVAGAFLSQPGRSSSNRGNVADDRDRLLGVDSPGALAARHAFQDYGNHQFRWAAPLSRCVSIVLAMAGWHYWALVWGSVTQTVAVAAGAW